MRFYGQYPQKLDSKHRVVVPSRLRDAMGEEVHGRLILTRGFDKCLFLFPASLWDEVSTEFAGSQFAGFDERMLQRLFFSKAIDVSTDKLGRILIPDMHRKLAGIEGDQVQFIGASNRIEIWSPERWATLEQAHEEQFEELAERFHGVLEARRKP
ncbi:division/cell wall cluster transcriptional repressor MraZ [bacterium]|nr:division/cell wall cluster transcriptional repressor MraZ [bacterium]